MIKKLITITVDQPIYRIVRVSNISKELKQLLFPNESPEDFSIRILGPEELCDTFSLSGDCKKFILLFMFFVMRDLFFQNIFRNIFINRTLLKMSIYYTHQLRNEYLHLDIKKEKKDFSKNYNDLKRKYRSKKIIWKNFEAAYCFIASLRYSKII
ncbi:MAG: hypothetical protein LW599_06545 [Rickettsiaceae bacterium]|jgi:hypothetical protein|nr:hypothetical protein [Rickettsiaceae bacterium]